jgi:hypothetical protein
MSKILALVCVAGLAASAASAQLLDRGANGVIREMSTEGLTVSVRGADGIFRVVDQNAGGFSGRAIGRTYDNISNLASGGRFYFMTNTEGNKDHVEDISFAPGPWAGSFGRSITNFDLAIGSNAAGVFDLLVEILPRTDVNFTATPQLVATPAPIGEIAIENFNFAAGNGGIFNFNLVPDVITLPNGVDAFAVRMRIGNFDNTDPNNPIFTGTTGAAPGTIILNNNTGASALRTLTGAIQNVEANLYVQGVSIGSSTVSFGADRDQNGTLTGFATPRWDVGEHRWEWLTGSAGTRIFFLNSGIGFRGDLVPTPPACTSFAFPTANNTFASQSLTLANNGTQWVCFTIAEDYTDENGRYIDIDTEGSTADTAIAVFNADGQLIAQGDDTGSGVNAQLSFGIGRRPAVGDGLQYDGRNFDDTAAVIRGLSAGTYFVAVTTASSSAAFGDGFTVSGTGTGGAATLRIRANNGDFSTLETSVPPIAQRLVGLASEDPIVAPGALSPTFALFGPAVIWYDVQLCRDSSATDAVTIAAQATTTGTPSVIFVFDNNGNLVAEASGNTAAQPTITFTDAPVLPAGTYFIAQTYGPLNDVAPDALTNGRWHFRPREGDAGFAFQLAVEVNWADCPSGGNLCNYDYNQDENVDLTDAQLMAQVAAGIITPDPSWLSGDMNGDENADLTDAQQLAQFVASGVCPI